VEAKYLHKEGERTRQLTEKRGVKGGMGGKLTGGKSVKNKKKEKNCAKPKRKDG